MRVIASGIALNEEINAKLIIIWHVDDDLKCPFNLLFENSTLFSIESKKRKYYYLMPPNQSSALKRLRVRWRNGVIGVSNFVDYTAFADATLKKQLNLLALAKRRGNLYIRTWEEFGENNSTYRYLTPIAPIQKKIQELTSRFSELTIGVHIRRTDNENSKRFSPDHLFIQKMQEELQQQPAVSFFLCTDDPAVEELMVKQFGDKVIIYEKQYTRRNIKGMQDALVELYCLSKTDRILGSYWSSFSEVAASLNHAELETVKLL